MILSVLCRNSCHPGKRITTTYNIQCWRMMWNVNIYFIFLLKQYIQNNIALHIFLLHVFSIVFTTYASYCLLPMFPIAFAHSASHCLCHVLHIVFALCISHCLFSVLHIVCFLCFTLCLFPALHIVSAPCASHCVCSLCFELELIYFT